MATEKWPTAITDIEPGKIRLRGYDITELMEKLTFAQTIFLTLRGELPNDAEAKIMEAILVSSVDHGVTPPSVLAARTVASGGNPLNAAVAAGVLAIGDVHGGAIEQCARILQEWASKDGEVGKLGAELVKEFLSKKKRLPGFGHRLHTTDPRTVKLFEIADELNFAGRHMQLAREAEKQFEIQKGTKLPINVDGAIGAVISDMGFDWRLGKGFFILSRVAGLIAHIYEETTRFRPMRRLGDTNYEYDGPAPRKIG
ncbi:MAG: citryl-CoA lyase [Candidatus Zixiibacteriota bacterium]|nr:MAG: citryl-CoA lyase [candidate division Zixibacteria bacterium]